MMAMIARRSDGRLSICYCFSKRDKQGLVKMLPEDSGEVNSRFQPQQLESLMIVGCWGEERGAGEVAVAVAGKQSWEQRTGSY